MKGSKAVLGVNKLFLVDGHSFCYRAYYAIRDLSNSRGEPTNAIYGFITMLRKLIEEERPSHVAICFDSDAPTFRHKQYEDYKANRKPMPDDLADQIEPIKEVCRAFRYAVYEAPGYEADDVIGTLARQGEERDYDVFIITGDKDAMQLVDEKIKILNPHKEGLIYNSDLVRKKFSGLGPERVVDIMALMGDASDNIPGVPGIGEKTAVKLIREFGSLEALYRNLERIHSKSQRAKLQDHRDQAELSKQLARIDTQVPMKIEWEALEITEPDTEKLADLFTRFEFRSLLKGLKPTGETEGEDRDYRVIENEEEFKKFVDKLAKVKAFSFDTETTDSDPMRASLVGLSFCWEAFSAYYIPVSSPGHSGPGLPKEKVLAALRTFLEDPEREIYGQNMKYDWIIMKCEDIRLRVIAFDTMIASYLINPVKFSHNLDDIALEYLGVRKITTASLIGSGRNQITMDQVPLEKIGPYACEDADCVMRLVPVLAAKLQEHNLTGLFTDVEMPLLEVLAQMELNGVSLDVAMLRQLSGEVGRGLDELSREIYREAGEEFNINSPKQLSAILFEKLKLPVIKKTKTGYSTDMGVLEKLAQEHEMPRKLLEFREKSKLKSTYLDALPAMIHPKTRRIHTSYHQTTTATGRLSSSEPNLQNIPVRTEEGRLIRKAFIPRTQQGRSGKILSADYSQIELRILAHFSEDPNLTRAFEQDRDVHSFTATLLFDVKEKEVTRRMRDVAKTVNFSIIYGKTAYGLSRDMGISISEAEGFIDNYFSRYKKVSDYLESQKEQARQTGFLVTLLGRRAYFPDINSKNVQIRQFAERAAINAPIQGSAADLIKLAMISIQRHLDDSRLPWAMTMQVHDELVFEIPAEDAETAAGYVRNEMEKAYPLKVPLKVDVFVGDTWYKG